MEAKPLLQNGASKSLSNSTKVRSTEIFSKSGVKVFIALNVSGSSAKPRLAWKRKPRIIRKASSLKRSLATPTARKTCFSKSSKPWNKSTISPVSSKAKALTRNHGVWGLLLASAQRKPHWVCDSPHRHPLSERLLPHTPHPHLRPRRFHARFRYRLFAEKSAWSLLDKKTSQYPHRG